MGASFDKKSSSYKRGLWAETLCAWFLRAKGYRILEQRYKKTTGEIDLIARRGKKIAFIEVKARDKAEDAYYAINRRNRKRVTQTAQGFLAKHRQYDGFETRFDVMVVTRYGWPRHLVNAWAENE